MAISLVNLGAAANDGNGDPLRNAFQKTNDNISDLVARTGPASTLGTVPTGSLSLNATGARAASVTVTLGGNVTITPSNIPGSVLAIYTILVKQDGTGGRTVTYPANTTHLNGGDGSINGAANSVSVITLMTADGGTTWYAAAIDSRATALDALMFNPGANGDYYWTADRPCTLALGSVLKRGTGTLAYNRSLSATPTTFSSVSGNTTFARGDTLRVTVTSFSGWLSFDIDRTA